MALTRTRDNRTWSYDNKLSSETETREFMYGLVRLLKPRLVVETGCYLGEMSECIGQALQVNGHGLLKTCDTDREMTEAAFIRCEGLPVEVYNMPALDMLCLSHDVELAYIDGSEFRTAEMAALKLADRAWVVLHDAMNPAYQPPADWWRYSDVNALHFPTPLGLAVYEVNRR